MSNVQDLKVGDKVMWGSIILYITEPLKKSLYRVRYPIPHYPDLNFYVDAKDLSPYDPNYIKR